MPCDDGEGLGCGERLSPGGVFPALFVGAAGLVGVGVGERCEGEGDGDGVPVWAGGEPEVAPGSELLAEPGAGPLLWPCPVVP